MSNKTATPDFDALFAEADMTLSAGGSYPKLDCEGVWLVKVIEPSYGASQKGDTKRGMFKVEVIQNLKGSEDKVTARTNLYVTAPSDVALATRNIAPWYGTLKALVGSEKLTVDAVDHDDIIQNIVAHSAKCIKLGKDILVVLQLRANAKKEGEFYKNVFVYSPADFAETADSIESLPTPPQPAKGAEQIVEDWP